MAMITPHAGPVRAYRSGTRQGRRSDGSGARSAAPTGLAVVIPFPERPGAAEPDEAAASRAMDRHPAGKRIAVRPSSPPSSQPSSPPASARPGSPAGASSGAASAASVGVPARARPVRRRPAPVRLTRRGRVVVAAAVVLGVLGVFALGALALSALPGGLSADAGTASARPAAKTVVARPGETVWDIARRVAPSADPRAVVDRIADRNGLTHAGELRTGQSIVVPANVAG